MTKEEQKRMVVLYDELKSSQKVADILGYSKATIRKYLKRNNVILKPNTKTDEEKQNVLRLYKESGSIVQVSREIGFKADTINKILGNNKEIYFQKYHYPQKIDYDSHIFDIIDNEEKAYWLGFLYADGSVSDSKGYPCCVSVGLKPSDVGHIYKFADFVGYDKNKLYVNDKIARICISNRHMSESLCNLGCYPRKTYSICFPDSSIVPEHLLRHFIRGVFDGDGTLFLRRNGKFVCGIVGNINFIFDCQDYISSVLGTSKVKIYDIPNTVVGEWKKEGKDAIKIAHYLYDDSTIYLDRKFNICQKV